MNTVSDGSTNLRLRLANSNDADAIASVLVRAFAEYQSRYTPGGFAATTPDAKEVLLRISEGPVWVATVLSEVVATGSVVLKNESLYIRGMAVLPNLRGFRIGELLLSEIEAFAVAQGCTRLFLSTTPFLQRAIKLYERNGFQRIPDPPHDLFGTPLFTMEKRLEQKGPSPRLHEVHTR